MPHSYGSTWKYSRCLVTCVRLPPLLRTTCFVSSGEYIKCNCSIHYDLYLNSCKPKEVKNWIQEIIGLSPHLAWLLCCTTSQPAVKAASLVRDCLPEPPTPTSSAWPRSMRMMRCTRVRCSRASSKSTRFILDLFSLYSSRISCTMKKHSGVAVYLRTEYGSKQCQQLMLHYYITTFLKGH